MSPSLIRPTALILAVALVAAACSNGDDSIAEPNGPTEASTETTATPSPTTAAIIDPDPTATPDPNEAVAAWVRMWDGAELLVTNPEAASSEILAVASEDVFAQLDTIYNPTVDSDVANSARVFDNSPVVDVQADGTVAISDCMFETPKAGNATIWYSGVAEATDDGWMITSVTLTSEIGCVPASLATEAIAGYEAYWDARVEFWDPADPANPLVQQTMAGAYLELIEGLLIDHATRGLALRGRPITHPELIEVRSATEVAILDCRNQDTGRGLFDIESGERLGDIPVVREGQRDLGSAVMVLDNGVWKVSDLQGQADVSCDTAPTPQGLPVV